jgi:hypothetical protein
MRRNRPTGDGTDDVVQLDVWTEPLTGSTSSESQRELIEGAASPSLIRQPTRSGCGPVIASWVAAAIQAEPDVQEWCELHRSALTRAAMAAQRAGPSDKVNVIVLALFAAEGGTAMVEDLATECARTYCHERERQPAADLVLRELPDGTRVTVAASVHSSRTPVTTLCYPTTDGSAYLTVLRDARLGTLAGIVDAIAERYLLPASEILAFILVGTVPRIAPLRMGLRYRQFRVHGVPVTACSRIAIEVDPQIEPADLARAFAGWQRANKVTPCHTDPKLAALAGNLIGRLWTKPARRTRSRPRPGVGPDSVGPEVGGVAAASHVTWTTLATDVNSTVRHTTRSTAAVVRILMPFDKPHPPRWMPSATVAPPDPGLST